MYSYISLYSYISGRGSTINHQSCLRVNKSKELDAASSRWIRKETRRVWLEFINFLLKKKEIRDEYRADKFQNERELTFLEVNQIYFPSHRSKLIRSVTNESKIESLGLYSCITFATNETWSVSCEFSRASFEITFYLPNRDRLRPIILSRIASPTLEYVPGRQKSAFNAMRRGWRIERHERCKVSLFVFLAALLFSEKGIFDSFLFRSLKIAGK